MKKLVSGLVAMLLAAQLCVPVLAGNEPQQEVETGAVSGVVEGLGSGEATAEAVSAQRAAEEKTGPSALQGSGLAAANGSAATAIEIPANGAVTYPCDGPSWYYFDLPGRGVIAPTLANSASVTGSFSYALISAENLANQGDPIISAYIPASAATRQLGRYGVTAGRYYLRLYVAGNRTETHTVSINFTGTSNWESDNNGSAATADPLQLGKTMNGSKQWRSWEYSWFKVTVRTQGVLTFDFRTQTAAGLQKYYDLELYPATPKGVDTRDSNIFERVSMPASQARSTPPRIGVRKGTYYIRLYKSAYLPEGTEFSLNVRFDAMKNWESEPRNDRYNTAEPLRVNQPVYGTHGWYSRDFYVLKVPSTRTYRFSYTNDKSKKSYADYLYIISKASEAKKASDGKLFYAAKKVSLRSNRTTVTSVTLKRGTYYVVLNRNNSGNPSPNNSNYTFTCFDSASPAVKSFKLSATKLTLRQRKAAFLKISNVLPANTPVKKAMWSTSDATVATVTQGGKVVAVGKGTAVITCNVNGTNRTCRVTVR